MARHHKFGRGAGRTILAPARIPRATASCLGAVVGTARDLGSNPVQLEEQIRRPGCIGGQTAADARRREPQAEEAVGRVDARQRCAEGASGKKMVGPAAKREAVAHLRGVLEVSERRACSLLAADRKMIRDRSRRPPDTELRARLRELANQRRRFGYRRLFILLRAEGEPSGINRIYRLYREEGLAVRKRRSRRKAVGTRAPILVQVKPNARWSLDFVHDQLACGRRFRILNIVDDVTRGVLGGDSRHAARSPPARHANERQPLAWQRALPFFCQKLLQRSVVQHRLGQQLLQLAVLVFQHPQPFGLRHIHAAVFALPVVQGGFRDAVFARQVSRLCPSLVLAQNRNDLLFRKPATLHRPSLQQGRTLILRRGKTQWQVNVKSAIPIQNIYYMFCYAWSKFASSNVIEVGSVDSPELVDLFAKVLS